MKRFITYFYLYENGEKSINVGFARVTARNEKVNMDISIRDLGPLQELGKIYMLVNHEGIKEVEIGEMKIFNGQGNARVVIDTIDMTGSGYNMEDAIGMCIRLGDKGYIASCWKEECADAVGGRSITIRPWRPPEFKKSESTKAFDVEVKEIKNVECKVPVVQEKEVEDTYQCVCEKIDITDIHSLPSRVWYLCNNSFLLHGFWNYGFLILKKEMENGTEKMALGVPGVFEKPEMVMALLFEFPEFVSLPETIKTEKKNGQISLEKKENQEPKPGEFGCWFVNI